MKIDDFVRDVESTFLETLAAAEHGVADAVPVLKALVAASDEVAALLEREDAIAVRYAVVEDRL